MKIYKSNEILGISLMMPNGRSRYILFEALSSGGSQLVVRNPVTQAALERHESFGKSFWLEKDTDRQETEVEQMVRAAEAPVEVKEEVVAEETPAEVSIEADAQQEETAEELQQMSFSCFDDARVWVHETYGIGLKKLMSKKAVIEKGRENGVEITIED